MKIAGEIYRLYKTDIRTKAKAGAIARQRRRLGFRARVVRMKLYDEGTGRLSGRSLWEVYTR